MPEKATRSSRKGERTPDSDNTADETVIAPAQTIKEVEELKGRFLQLETDIKSEIGLITHNFAQMFKDLEKTLNARDLNVQTQSQPRLNSTVGNKGERYPRKANNQAEDILEPENQHENDQFDHTLSPPHLDDPYYAYGPGTPHQVHPPAIINQIHPENYEGDKGKARHWIRHYERTMRVNGYSDRQKLLRAIAYLKGPALCWYNVTTARNTDLDWYGFKAKFLDHFCGFSGQAILAEKIASAKQEQNEHPKHYMMRIMDMCLEHNPNISEQELMIKVHKGMRAEYAHNLTPAKPVSLWTIDWLSEVFSAFSDPPSRSVDKSRSFSPRRSNYTPTRNYDNATCHNCNEKGHIIRNCPLPKDEEKISTNRENYLKKKEFLRTQPKRINMLKLKAMNLVTKLLNNRACDITKPIMTLNVNGLDIEGRVDSGADITAIPSDLADKLKLKIEKWKELPLQAINKTEVIALGLAPVTITYKGIKKSLPVVILPSSYTQGAIWGWDLLHTFEAMIDFGKEFETKKNSGNNIETNINTVQLSEEHPIDKITHGDITHDVKKLLFNILLEFKDVFSTNDQDIGRTSTITHRIILKDDIPIKKQPYRIPHRSRDNLKQTLDLMLQTGAIRPSKSPYASPVFFVDKDQGKGKRLVADFRALNSKTIQDRTPMPHPEDIFGLLAHMKAFTKLDITSMFNQIEIEESDIEKTAITTTFGLFECPLMPFGLVNAPATAVRLMREVLRDLIGCFVYFDDIIVYAPDNIELIKRTKQVLERLRQHNLKLKPTKCKFNTSSVKFLGHIISEDGIEMDPSRFEKVMKFPVPRNQKQVRSFHGLASYNRKFIKDFAEIAQPLSKLMGKSKDFIWTSEAQTAFERLKEALTKPPILVHFDPEAELELRTDASSYAIGAVLYQKHADSKLTGTILYHSKTLTQTQRNYSATERELLAAFNAITELQHYLFGKKFTLVTDHSALSLLKNHKDPHQRIARWVAQLQSYDFDVVYKNGKSHVDADCLSRLIDEQPAQDDIDLEQCKYMIKALNLSDDDRAHADIDFKLEQREDEYCSKFIDILESTELRDSQKLRLARNFTIQDDKLYRIHNDDLFLLVIPEKRRNAVLLSCHDIPLCGHLGFSRTYSIAKTRYYWPKMRRDVKKYVASCFNCQRRKPTNIRRKGFIQPLPIAEDIFDTIGIDLITKLPVTHSGYCAILVCTDNLSKYTITVPLRDEKAETITHAFFTQVIAKHGCPKVVISDRGYNISGTHSKDFYALFGIKRRLSSAYHPQTNGQTERFNRTLATSLTIYSDRNQTNWSDYLAALTFAYNITEHAVTQVTPFELVFGRRARIPLDNILSRSEFIDPIRPRNDVRSAAALELMKEAIVASQQANKRRLDSRLNVSNFEPGDLVLFERPTRLRGQAEKLTYSYTGPYKISKKIGDVSFELQALDSCTDRVVTRIAHSCNLRKFIPRERDVTDEAIDPKFVPIEPDIESIIRDVEEININRPQETQQVEEISEFLHELDPDQSNEILVEDRHSLVVNLDDVDEEDISSPSFEALSNHGDDNASQNTISQSRSVRISLEEAAKLRRF